MTDRPTVAIDDVIAHAWRIAAWAPDAARDLLITAIADGGDDIALAAATEVLAKLVAVTGAWELARASVDQAAEIRRSLGDLASAAALVELGARFPLAPFGYDAEALEAELSLICAAVSGELSKLDRAIVEIRRALTPRSLTGNIEAWFRLTPSETLLLMAAVGSVTDPRCGPPRSAEIWHRVLGGADDAADQLVSRGLATSVGELVPAPRAVSRLLGRNELDPPATIRLVRPPSSRDHRDHRPLSEALVDRSRYGVVLGSRVSASELAAGIARRAHATSCVVAIPILTTGQPTASDLAEMVIEGRLFGAVVAVDYTAWQQAGVDLARPDIAARVLSCGPVVVTAGEDPPLPREWRSFTVQAAER
jgi:hypothetical protein